MCFFVHCTTLRAKTFQHTSGIHGILLLATPKVFDFQQTCPMVKSLALAICFLGHTYPADQPPAARSYFSEVEEGREQACRTRSQLPLFPVNILTRAPLGLLDFHALLGGGGV